MRLQFIKMWKTIFFVILSLSSVWSELVSEKYARYGTNDLIPIVMKGIYSTDYTKVINTNVSYLFLYDYMLVNILLIKIFKNYVKIVLFA